MTGNSQFSSSSVPCTGNRKAKIVDGSFVVVAGKGSIVISPFFTLKNVIHVPLSLYNLLSVNQITLDLRCRVICLSSHCEFQDLASGTMIGNARNNNGIYMFNVDSLLGLQDQKTCFNSIFTSRNSDIM